jgi:hypothetical protein
MPRIKVKKNKKSSKPKISKPKEKTIVDKKVERYLKLQDRNFIVYLGYGTYDRSGVILEHSVVTEVSDEEFAWLKDQWQCHPVDVTQLKI